MNEGGISAPSETCKDIETDAAFEGRIQCIDDTKFNRCLKSEKKFNPSTQKGDNIHAPISAGRRSDSYF
jgi:hypothetical protein